MSHQLCFLIYLFFYSDLENIINFDSAEAFLSVCFRNFFGKFSNWISKALTRNFGFFQFIWYLIDQKRDNVKLRLTLCQNN